MDERGRDQHQRHDAGQDDELLGQWPAPVPGPEDDAGEHRSECPQAKDEAGGTRPPRLLREGDHSDLVGAEDSAHADRGDHHVDHPGLRESVSVAPGRARVAFGRATAGRRRLGGALQGEKKPAGQPEDGGDDQGCGQPHLEGQEGGEQRPHGEDQLVDDALERECTAEAIRVGCGVGPPGANHRADRRLGRAGERDHHELEREGCVPVNSGDEGKQQRSVRDDEGRQQATLPEAVHPSAGDQGSAGSSHREGRREDTRLRVGARAGADQQDDPQAVHRDRQAREESCRGELPRAREREGPSVGGQHEADVIGPLAHGRM